MTSPDESLDRLPRPASAPRASEPDAPGAQIAARRRHIVPPTGWRAIAAWAGWRHYPLADSSLFLAAPDPSAEADSHDGPPPINTGPVPASDAPGSRRKRIAMVVLIELLASAGVVGAIIAWATHRPTLGMLALGAAIVANLILWIWARAFSGHEPTQDRDTGGQRP